jgi:protocatechuate 3,4-dioxygenase beta subunit
MTRQTHRRTFAAAILVVAAGAAAGGQQIFQRDQRTIPQRGTAAIAGSITDTAGEPVRRAQVSIAAAEAGTMRTTYTDDAGVYAFPNLPAGRYSLSATKPGYVRAAYGAKRHDRPGTPISLDEGQTLTNMRLTLARGGVITGQILDETGLPASGVQVRVLEYRTVLGERRLAAVPNVGNLLGELTDDRGLYRLYGLPAGEYVIAASPRTMRDAEIRAMTDAEIRAALQEAEQPASARVGAMSADAGGKTRQDEGQTVGFTPVYFPGTTVAMSAQPVTIAAGEERAGIDFRMQLVPTARVEGTVIAPAGIAPQNVQLSLVADSQMGAPGLLGVSLLNSTRPDAEGRFSYRGLAPGRYTLSARAVLAPDDGGRGGAPGAGRSERTLFLQAAGGPDGLVIGSASGPEGPAFWATSEITVTGQNLDSIVLSLQPGMTMTGRVQFEGASAAPTDFGRVRLMLQPGQGSGVQVMTSFPTVRIGHGGEFTVSNIVPGRYVMTGLAPPARESLTPTTWRLTSVVVDGRDILDFPLDVAPFQNLSDVVATFTDRTQRVAGSLQDPTGRPAPDYTIVVFPGDSAYWMPRARRIRTARPGTDGRFTIDNLPPGSYRMAAVVDMAADEAFDPAFLEQLVAASYAFELAAGEQKTQDLRISGGGH